MKVLVHVTHTNDCINKWQSLEAIGHEVHVIQYDNRPHDLHLELVRGAEALKPDFIVHIGAIEQYHCRPVPRPDILKALRAVAPHIHICGDGADHPWWPLLEEYDREGCFDVQVSIDGNWETPLSSMNNGLVMLTPIDPRPFVVKPWRDRTVKLGMVGGRGHTRRYDAVTALEGDGLLKVWSGLSSYGELAEKLCDCKAVFNHAATGTGDRLHVKGRVVEAGFAHAALFELAGSPTNLWFTAGLDYLEYDSATHLRHLLSKVDDHALSMFSSRLFSRMVEEHHPRVFWEKVLAKAGLTCGTSPNIQ